MTHDVKAGWSIPVYLIADEVAVERYAQLKEWGHQHHDDDVIPASYWKDSADDYKRSNDRNHQFGHDNWAAILLEEIYEALAEEDPAKRREEFVQCAAVIFAIIEDMDTRTTSDQQPQSQAS